MKLSQRLSFILVSFVFAAAFAFADIAPAPIQYKSEQAIPTDGDVIKGSFSNGLSYYVVKNTEPANRMYLRLAVKAGSVLEADDQKGVAHMVEHMAFNGTEHFKKNELIDYFESIGMAFGPEVNAYTAFDETVYMLEIPADSPEMLKNSLQVLRDWACAVSFDQDELDKERGVIIEEWRLGRGASGRVSDKQIPFLFNGSKYGERLPIGDPEIVKNVSRARVVDFYKTWYRPNLMSVVIAGDIDPQSIVKSLGETMGTIPVPEKSAKRPSFPVTPQNKPVVLVVRDPEIQYTTIQVLEQYPFIPTNTVGDYRRRIARTMAFAIFNARLNEKTLSADPLMLGAQTGAQRIVKPTYFNYIGMVPVNGKFVPAFNQLEEELSRFEKYGVTAAELAREKKSMLDEIDQAWLDRDKVHSSDRANQLVQTAVNGEPALSVQNQYDILHSIVPEITAKEIASYISEWYTGRGRLLIVTAPENVSDIPSEADLLSLWQNWTPKAPLTPYAEANLDRPLIDGIQSVPGKVIKEEILSTSGIKQWTLSNGTHVVLFPTKFKSNEILVRGWSKGGTSLVSDADYPSASVALSYAESSGLNGFSAVDLQKKLAGKSVSIRSWIEEAVEGFDGSSSVEDLETLCQLINVGMTRPNFTEEGWQSLYTQLKTEADSRANDPEERFSDLKVKLLYGDDIRHANLSPSFVAALDRNVAERVRLARYSDASDFTIAFVGSIDEATLKQLVEKWIGSLPSSGTKEDARDVSVPFPKGVHSDTLKMGIDPKSQVYIAFGGKADGSKAEGELFSALYQLLDIRFREVVREDMSGSYGVDVGGVQTAYPVPTYMVTINFGCEPGREDSLTKAVFDQIAWVKSAPIPDSYITKLRETVRRNREEGLKNNGYWLWQIVRSMVRGYPLEDITATDAAVSQITGSSMQAVAKKYLDENNYVKAYLMPEKTVQKK